VRTSFVPPNLDVARAVKSIYSLASETLYPPKPFTHPIADLLDYLCTQKSKIRRHVSVTVTMAVRTDIVRLISRSSSFRSLKKNQAGRIIRGSRCKRVDSAFLGSNSPIEDRFSMGVSENLNFALVSVIDGHGGHQCAQYLQNKLNQQISRALHERASVEDDFKVLLDLDLVENMDRDVPVEVVRLNPPRNKALLAPSDVKKCLAESFTTVDNNFSMLSLSDINKVLAGHVLTREMEKRISMAGEGACALTILVQEEAVTVACTGDCRAVLGVRPLGNRWKARYLSSDQDTFNQKEVLRLSQSHPGEKVVIDGRILGYLAPFRAFGDVHLKWDSKYLVDFFSVPSEYKTPPYLIAEPVVREFKLLDSDQFLIVASDGFWECISNDEAVSIVADVMEVCDDPCSEHEDVTCHSGKNAATHLLYHALGGTGKKVAKMLLLQPEDRRWHRDDITIMVIYL